MTTGVRESTRDPHFAIVFKKLREGAANQSVLADSVEIRRESEGIAELMELVAELETRDETTTYTSS